MPYDVHVEQAGPRALAAVRAVTTPQRLSTDIIRLLDQVWPLLREQGARTGHNVVIYHPGEGGEFTIEAGVEVLDGFEERCAVLRGPGSVVRRQRPPPRGRELGGLRRLGRRSGQTADRHLQAAQLETATSYHFRPLYCPSCPVFRGAK